MPAELPILPYQPDAQTWKNLREMFVSLEFKSLLGRIPNFTENGLAPVIAAEEAEPKAVFAARTERITGAEALHKALEAVRSSGMMALLADADATLPMRANLRGLAFAPNSETGYYVAIRPDTAENEGGLGGLFGAGESNAEAGEYAAGTAGFCGHSARHAHREVGA